MQSGSTSKIQLGERFGLLSVRCAKGHLRRATYTESLWECVCDCGQVTVVRGRCLLSGDTKSCGCRRGYRRSSPDAPFNEVLYFYRRNAAIRKLDFSLSEGEFKDLILKDCYWCGSAPSIFKKTGFAELVHGGVDRLDPNEGYTVANSVPCCQTCNWMKSNMTKDSFVEHIQKIASRIIAKILLA